MVQPFIRYIFCRCSEKKVVNGHKRYRGPTLLGIYFVDVEEKKDLVNGHRDIPIK